MAGSLQADHVGGAAAAEHLGAIEHEVPPPADSVVVQSKHVFLGSHPASASQSDATHVTASRRLANAAHTLLHGTALRHTTALYAHDIPRPDYLASKQADARHDSRSRMLRRCPVARERKSQRRGPEPGSVTARRQSFLHAITTPRHLLCRCLAARPGWSKSRYRARDALLGILAGRSKVITWSRLSHHTAAQHLAMPQLRCRCAIVCGRAAGTAKTVGRPVKQRLAHCSES